MKYLVIDNEKSVREVFNKAYKGRLSAKLRKQAEVALLKANPELKKFKSISKGFIVFVPTISGEDKIDYSNLIDPVNDIAREAIDNLKLFRSSLSNKFVDFESRQRSNLDTLKAAGKELKKQPNGDSIAQALKTHLEDSIKLNKKNKKLGLEALSKLQKTLATFER